MFTPGGNIALRANCPLPVPKGVERSVRPLDASKGLRFQLNPGDRGQCQSDHLTRSGALFWERAELRQVGGLDHGQIHDISFTLHLPQGFIGARETFLQIHSWAPDCKTAPSVLLMFHFSQLELRRLRWLRSGASSSKGKHDITAVSGAALREFRKAPRRVRLRLDLRNNPASVALFLDGRRVTEPAQVEIPRCARPYLKLGIYRPGTGRAKSVAIFNHLERTTVRP